MSFGSNISVSKLLFVTYSVAKFCTNFSLSIIVLCTFLSNNLITANPDISSMNGAFTFIYFCSLGFNTICSFGKNGIDLFKKLTQQSHEFIIPSNSNIFLILKTKSTFSCISDTNIKMSNLSLCICIIIGIMNNTLTKFPFPT